MSTNKQSFGINYVDLNTWLHHLNGVTKFLLFITWITVVLTTFDLRIIIPLILLGLYLLKATKVPFLLINHY